MQKDNLFYKYYDTLFKAKDYQEETKMVFALTKKFGIKNPKRVLEIGCGTGNHTILLSKKAKKIVAIDIDKNMINLARRKIGNLKIKNVEIKKTDIEKLKEGGFDLIVALFNVVTYLPTFKALENFMKVAAEKLNPKGLLIFDIWNGIAAILDPPKTKIISLYLKNKKLKSKLIPKTDLFNQQVILNYNLTLFNGRKVEKRDNFSINQTLWTPMQISDSIKSSGMSIIFCSPLLRPNKLATHRDWKIMFCVKKLN